VDEVPITPEKIRKALRAKEQGKAARYGPEVFPAIPFPEPVRIPTPAEGGDGRARDRAATGAGGVRGAVLTTK
jgi:hypothetical protein